ncbi:hypothetical protein PUN28_012960 [Cardiocondyla obscurior]|uniref:Uncharacterized protein n=1 Tax=Cardiocondyla obscurior TaxID=286306 RepID=A0AAW2FBT9_9HYME
MRNGQNVTASLTVSGLPIRPRVARYLRVGHGAGWHREDFHTGYCATERRGASKLHNCTSVGADPRDEDRAHVRGDDTWQGPSIASVKHHLVSPRHLGRPSPLHCQRKTLVSI